MNIKTDHNLRISTFGSLAVIALYMLGSYFILKGEPDYLLQVITKASATVLVITITALNLRLIKGWNFLFPTLILCLIGDVLLAGTQLYPFPELAFQLGIMSFFVAYLTIGIALFKKSSATASCTKLGVFIIVALLGAVQFSTISVSGTLMIIVIAYIGMTTILLTGATSYFLADKRHNAFFFIAGLMFYISDSMIGQNEFGSMNHAQMETAIMLTYGIGHSCLMLGTSQLKENV